MLSSIIHIDLDSFFVSCERLHNPELIGKPVMVGGSSDRGVVAACSYEARAFGVHSAMPMKKAKALCPQAIIVGSTPGIYSKYSTMVTNIIAEESPLYEKSSIDEFYIDVSGLDKFIGAFKWAQALRKRIITETELPISFGLASSKTTAKIATSFAKPNGELYIKPGEEKAFLAPLSLQKIPMVGKQTFLKLTELGITTAKQVQAMNMAEMKTILGKQGEIIWKKANGVYFTSVTPYHERKSYSVSQTFMKDIADTNAIHEVLYAMSERLAFYLRKGNKKTACVAVTIRYSNFKTLSKQCTIDLCANDKILKKHVIELFTALYQKGRMVRLVGVRYSNLAEDGGQINLFDNSEETAELYTAMDKIRQRFGKNAVRSANTLDVKRVGMNHNPFNGQEN